MFFSLITIQTYNTTNPTINFGSTFDQTKFRNDFTIQVPNALPTFSVDSIDVGIVNNRFQSNVVPEPSSFVLIGLGSLGFLNLARRRQQTRRSKNNSV
ncbi:PEP-CTERM sorting domain-containing protein [Thalassoglobus sp. JC818]|uniref:PEP-CTERM sorting domain-containing protein n=1 Tax=Thalassoglobus sp. JC818 TaxID=3232136 RepID=UPI00345AF34D